MKKLMLGTAFAFLAPSLAAGFTACSSSDSTPATTTPEAGIDRKVPEPPPDPPPPPADAGLTGQACLDQCEKDHPSGLVLDKKIDDCWSANCKAPCVDGTDAGFDAGRADAGDGGVLACKNDVQTDDQSCDVCTKTFCCASWDGCFDDKDCTALNDCRSNCPP